ncbi:MAG: hypothetical protein PHU77_10380 [Simplicispira sp.]|nr:hypothetical protein [Simplicispira sp.]
MSMQIDPSHLPAQGTPVRAPGEGAAPRSPQANTSAAAPGAAGTPAATGAPPVAGTAPVTAATPGTPGTPAAPAPAPVAAAPAQTTQVHISPQARQTVGEAAAALQRQGLLLDALDLSGRAPGAVPAGAPGSTPAAAATGQALAAAVLASATRNATRSASAATGASALLSTTAAGTTPAVAPGAHLQALAAPTGTAPALAAGVSTAVQSAGPTAGASAASRPLVVAGPHGPGAATGTAPTSAAPTWPSGGVSAPLQSLLSTLVQQSTAAVQAQRVLAIQPWPAALLAQVDGSAGQRHSAGVRTDGPPPLQTWLVREGVVQTPEGPRGVSVTVRVPAPWLQALEQTQAAATPTRSWQVWLLHAAPHTPAPAPSAAPLQAAFAGPSQALPSGTFALALESAGGGRTSALLVLEVQPMLLASAAQAGVYGREVAQHLRQDPWMQMAALQASGQAERDEDRARHGSAALCDTAGCPYLGRAACVQPFCAALNVVPQVAAVQAPGAPALGH